MRSRNVMLRPERGKMPVAMNASLISLGLRNARGVELMKGKGKGRTVIRHGVQCGARAPTIAFLWGNVLWPLSAEARMAFWNHTPRFAIWREEVEKEEDEVGGEEDAVDEDATKTRSKTRG